MGLERDEDLSFLRAGANAAAAAVQMTLIRE
jgi:hypothetical protein